MLSSRNRPLCRVTVVQNEGVPVVKYTVRQTEKLIEDLALKRDQSRCQGDKPSFRFFEQWVLELKAAVAAKRTERSLDCP